MGSDDLMIAGSLQAQAKGSSKVRKVCRVLGTWTREYTILVTVSTADPSQAGVNWQWLGRILGILVVL